MNAPHAQTALLMILSFLLAWPPACKKQSDPKEGRSSIAGARRAKNRSMKRSRKHSMKQARGRSRRRGHRTTEPVIIAPGTKLQGEVVHVVDGDTLHLKYGPEGRVIKARLAGINTPECHKQRVRTSDGRASAACTGDDEAGGLAAYTFLKKRVEGRTVHFDCVRKGDRCEAGRFGRPLVTVFVGDTDVNQELLAEGHGFSFTKYPSQKRARYCTVELAARKAGKGLWKLGDKVDDALALMSAKTRRWYKKHDALCLEAMKGK